MHIALRGLSRAEKEIAVYCLHQGEFRPEDRLRAYVTGFGTAEAEIKQVFNEIRNRENVHEELSKRSELKGKPITEELITRAINTRLEEIRTAYANKYKESLSARLCDELGGEDWVQTRRLSGNEPTTSAEALARAQAEFYDTHGAMARILDRAGWDGTVAMERSRNNQVQDVQVKSAATGQEIPIEAARQMAENLLAVTDLRVQSENSLIDAGAEAAIAAATIAMLLPSAGSSISLMALSQWHWHYPVSPIGSRCCTGSAGD